MDPLSKSLTDWLYERLFKDDKQQELSFQHDLNQQPLPNTHPHALPPKVPYLLDDGEEQYTMASWNKIPHKGKAILWNTFGKLGTHVPADAPATHKHISNTTANSNHPHHNPPGHGPIGAPTHSTEDWTNLSDQEKAKVWVNNEAHEKINRPENLETKPKKVGRLANKIDSQVFRDGLYKQHNPDVHKQGHYDDSLVQTHGELLHAGHGTADDLYRSYKHTPHSSPSMLLKYAIHRINNHKEYDSPEQGRKLDKDFMALHQFGKAAQKNGHVTPADLHHWIHENPHLISDLIQERKKLHNHIKGGIGLNVRNIKGEPHVALTRGLDSEVMSHEHALSSFADIPNSGFGKHMHHTWVPLKDIWYSYDAGPEYPRGDHGAENEFLVSHQHPRYEAKPEDIKPNRAKNGGYGEAGGIKPHHQDNTTDEQLATYLNRNADNGFAPRALLDHPNAGPKTREAVEKIWNKNGISVAENLNYRIIPRERVLHEYTEKLTKEGQIFHLAFKNPNLTSDDKLKMLELSSSMKHTDRQKWLGSLIRIVKNQEIDIDPKMFNKMADMTEDLQGVEDRADGLIGHLAKYVTADRISKMLERAQNLETNTAEGRTQIPGDKTYVNMLADHLFDNPNLQPQQADTLRSLLNAEDIPRLARPAQKDLEDPKYLMRYHPALQFNAHLKPEDWVTIARNPSTSSMSNMPGDVARTTMFNTNYNVGPTIPVDAWLELAKQAMPTDKDGTSPSMLRAMSYAKRKWEEDSKTQTHDQKMWGLKKIVDFIEARHLQENMDLAGTVEHYYMQLHRQNNRMRDPKHVIQPYPEETPRVAKMEVDKHHQLIHQLGKRHKYEDYLKAAQFVFRKPVVVHVDDALYHGDDLIHAALMAHGVENTRENRKALEGLVNIEEVSKAEVNLQECKPWNGAAVGVAEYIQRAIENQMVETIQLKGKHVQGSMVAHDQGSGQSWILKPNAGGTSSAAGVNEQKATSAQREACFWQVARIWGVAEWLPRADVVTIDSQQYVAIKMLADGWKNLEYLKDHDPAKLAHLLTQYQEAGVLHKWAILDFVLGQVDRHANNLMYKDDAIQLIDHGSAFAGFGFDPGHDPKSYIPFYLRYTVPSGFSKLPLPEKIAMMPTLDQDGDEILGAWVHQMDKDLLSALLAEYGVDPRAAVARLEGLQKLKQGMSKYINLLWITT